MKLAILICAAMILYLSVAMAQNDVPEPRKPNCDDFTLACTREYNPVCGDDGHTYSTECMLCLENKMKTQSVRIARKGECEPRTTVNQD
ncbi:hypothetical protein ACEWY4_027335 [Coilia grayii]|uniref:Kazal-like domain-containing protein n=1 Tax=Coilia grayii TaxID=363190 RepID=A0ABD1ISA2_9TELE